MVLKKSFIITAFFLSLATSTTSSVAAGYQQCGGINHRGPTVCELGYHCEKLNDYFWQCLPGQGTITSSPTRTRTEATPTVQVPRINDNDQRMVPEPSVGTGNVIPLSGAQISGETRIAESRKEESGPIETAGSSVHLSEPDFQLSAYTHEAVERMLLLQYPCAGSGKSRR